MTSLKIKRGKLQFGIQKLSVFLSLIALSCGRNIDLFGIPDHIDTCKDEKYNNTYFYDTTSFRCQPCGINAYVDPITSKSIFQKSDKRIIQDVLVFVHLATLLRQKQQTTSLRLVTNVNRRLVHQLMQMEMR